MSGGQHSRAIALAAAWSASIGLAVVAFQFYVLEGNPNDAHAYWLAAGSPHPYRLPPGMDNAFLYSPAFAQGLHLFNGLSWTTFLWLWRLMEAVAFTWLVAPLRLRWAGPLWLICVPEMLLGNIVGMTSVAIVLSVRRPEAWALPLLTKISPGCLGMVYLLAARQWVAVVRALGFFVVVIGASWLLDPHLWKEWVDFLVDQRGADRSVVARTGLAVGLVLYGAFSGRAWLLAPALLVSTPVLVGVEVLAYLAAIPRLRRWSSSSDGAAGRPTVDGAEATAIPPSPPPVAGRRPPR